MTELTNRTAATPIGLPTVKQLSVTAIKGLRLRHPESITLTAGGAVGNRDFLLVDEDNRMFSVTRSGAFLPYWSHLDPVTQTLSIGRDDRTFLADVVHRGEPVRARLFGDRHLDGHYVDGPWNAFLSDVAGVPVRLVRTATPSRGYDLHPVTLLSMASVAALRRTKNESPLESRLFRMLITFDGPDAFAEDGWLGAELEVGSARLRVGGPVPRCAAVQRDPDNAGQQLDTLRRINAVRGVSPSELGPRTLNLGVYAEVRRPGTISLGDQLRPRPAGAG